MTDHLVLMRHSEAAPWQPGDDDARRPLTPRGEQAAEQAGAWLASKGIRFDRVISSPAARARGTSLRLVQATGTPEDRVWWVDEVYGAPWKALLEIIDQEGRGQRCLALVGHNPGLQDLVRRLVPDAARGGLPPGGAVVVRVQGDRLGPGSVVLEDAWVPQESG